MATSTVKSACYTCDKQKITYACRGCSNEFCMEHLSQHNQFVAEQFDVFQNQCDQFRQKLIDGKKDSRDNLLLQQVIKWEEESIEKIKQTANECRNLLNKHIKDIITGIETRLNGLAEGIRSIHRENEYNEVDLNRLKQNLIQLENEFAQPANISIRQDPAPYIGRILVAIAPTKETEGVTQPISNLYPNPNQRYVDIRTRHVSINIPQNARWAQNGITVAGGNGRGGETNQLCSPVGLYLDENQTIFIADCYNHRIVQWKSNATSGQIVAGENGEGNRLDQLDYPTDVIIDKEANNLIICDRGNRRVMKWSLQSDTTKGEILLENIDCWGLIMDDQRYLYVSDTEKHNVTRYRIEEKNGTLVAGGNGRGNCFNQLDLPTDLFVDREYSVYVSDHNNHRVMKWVKGATEGIVVAGGQENSLNQLSYPLGVFVDLLSTVYVAEWGNHRVTRWRKGVAQGEVIVGGNGQGEEANQFYYPESLSFDQHGHLYVADYWNNRVQRFSLEIN